MTPIQATHEMFKILYGDSDDLHTKAECNKSARDNVPLSSVFMTKVDKHCGGTLGARGIRKLVYGLTHFSCGNTKLRVSLGWNVHSSYALKLTGPVGSGKSLAHGFIEETALELESIVAGLDKQL